MLRPAFILVVAAAWLAVGSVGWAQDEPSNDEVGFGGTDPSDDVGFGDSAPSADAPPISEQQAPSTKSKHDVGFRAYLRSDWALWSRRFDDNPFAKSRQSVDADFTLRSGRARLVLGLHAMVDFAYQVDRENYGRAVIETYETLIRGRDSYIAWTGDHVELAAGLQRVAFGSGELLSVVDIVNPRDEREPGLTDLEDRRLPVLMSRMTYFWKRHRVELIGVHEAFFQLIPPLYGPYNPIGNVLQNSSTSDNFEDTLDMFGASLEDIGYEHDPKRFSVGAQQVFARWTLNGDRADVGMYAGLPLEFPGISKFNELIIDARLDVTGLPDDAIVGVTSRLSTPIQHPRYGMVGVSVAKTIGDWLIHGELAGDIDRAVQLGDLTSVFPFVDFERRHFARWMLGLRFSGLEDGALSLEYTQGSRGNLFQDEYAVSPLFPVNPATLAGRWGQAFLRQRLNVEIVGIVQGPRLRAGGMVRGQISYKIRDDLEIIGGYIAYFEGPVDGLLTGYDENDRLFLRLRWDFSTD